MKLGMDFNALATEAIKESIVRVSWTFVDVEKCANHLDHDLQCLTWLHLHTRKCFNKI